MCMRNWGNFLIHDTPSVANWMNLTKFREICGNLSWIILTLDEIIAIVRLSRQYEEALTRFARKSFKEKVENISTWITLIKSRKCNRF